MFITYMGNEAAHGIIIPLADHCLGEHLVTWPVTLIISREGVTEVHQPHLTHNICSV